MRESKVKVAIQKSGRLNRDSIQLLQASGIHISSETSGLKRSADNFPIEILYMRDDDIPQYVEQRIADAGILGENEVLEKAKDVDVLESLGFAACRLSLAIPKDTSYVDLDFFHEKRVATSYPRILSDFFKRKNIKATIEEISGSVEIAPSIGLADAIFDVVSTGSTLFANGLKEVKTVLKSEAVLIANKDLSAEKRELLQRLLFRMQAVRRAVKKKYILLNAPNKAIETIVELLPGMKSPTVLPLHKTGWSSIHSIVDEDTFWDIITPLRTLGAEGILVIPVEKMLL